MTNSIELDEEIKEKVLSKSAKRGIKPSELLNKYVLEGLKNDISEEEREAKRKEFMNRIKNTLLF